MADFRISEQNGLFCYFLFLFVSGFLLFLFFVCSFVRVFVCLFSVPLMNASVTSHACCNVLQFSSRLYTEGEH